MHILIFNGRRSDAFGLHISGAGTFGSPARRVEKFTIPGRNGSMIIDEGTFENIQVTYDAAAIKTMQKTSSALREWLLSPRGYCRLEDTYHPDEYRMARFSGGLDFSEFTQFLRSAKLKLIFDCKPQRFLKVGEAWISVETGAKIRNPTSFDAKPKIVFNANSAECSVRIGECIISLSGVAIGSKISIDADTLDAYNEAGESLNELTSISGNIVLPAGNATDIIYDGVELLKIQPRWWIV